MKKLDKYFDLITKRSKVLGVFHHGSKVEGLDDKYSDSDYVVICEKKWLSVTERLKMLKKLYVKVHDIRDVEVIHAGFDMFETEENLVNVAYMTKDALLNKIDSVVKYLKWDEEVLMFLRNLSIGKIIFERDNFLTKLKKKYLKIPDKLFVRIDEKTKREIGWYWKKLEISFRRKDNVEFLDTLNKLLRFIQIREYLFKNSYPPSVKGFGKRGKKYGLTKLVKIEDILIKNIDFEKIYFKIDLFLKHENVFEKSKTMRG